MKRVLGSRGLDVDQVRFALAQCDVIVAHPHFQRVAKGGATNHLDFRVGNETKIEQTLPDGALGSMTADSAKTPFAHPSQDLISVPESVRSRWTICATRAVLGFLFAKYLKHAPPPAGFPKRVGQRLRRLDKY